jgi:hypothetical protein
MASMIAWDQESNATELIAGDRRIDRRYPILLNLRWKLIRRKRALDTGTGSTIDLSSGGILFESGRPLPEGLNVELAISWPVFLHNVAPLQLVARGRIVRSEGGRIAIRMIRHEFRTAGAPISHRGVPSASARHHSAFLSNVNGAASLAKIQ